jgi:hypothetical protein
MRWNSTWSPSHVRSNAGVSVEHLHHAAALSELLSELLDRPVVVRVRRRTGRLGQTTQTDNAGAAQVVALAVQKTDEPEERTTVADSDLIEAGHIARRATSLGHVLESSTASIARFSRRPQRRFTSERDRSRGRVGHHTRAQRDGVGDETRHGLPTLRSRRRLLICLLRRRLFRPFGNPSSLWARLALRRRATKSGGIAQEGPIEFDRRPDSLAVGGQACRLRGCAVQSHVSVHLVLDIDAPYIGIGPVLVDSQDELACGFVGLGCLSGQHRPEFTTAVA